ncbi:MAG: hypothetical protein JWN04_3448 [Myxococcaceae bacterium]|nr:hypothetical protein [Myxococcaceae bacterium]
MRKQLDGNALSARRWLSLGLLLTLGCSTDTSDHSANISSHARIFATVSATSELLVLDEVSHEQLASVSIGHGPAIVLSTPNREQLFTANWADNTVSAIDAASYAVTPIPMAGRPYVIAMAPDGAHVYVGVYTVNQIAVINTATRAIERTFDMASLPASIIVSPDGHTLYVATLPNGGLSLANGSLMAVSADTGAIVQQPLEVGGSPGWVTIGPNGKKVYTLNFTTDDVTVVDTASWKVDTTIKTGAGSEGIIGQVTPDGSRLYVTNHGTTELIAIDTATNTVVQHIPLSGKPVGITINTAGTRVYTTDFGPTSVNEKLLDALTYLTTGVYNGTGSGQVSEFDIATGAQVGTIAVTGPGPTSVVVLPAPAVATK